MTTGGIPKAPAHLREGTRKWWRQVSSTYMLEPHHYRLLTLLCEAWDRCQEAREALAEHGSLTFLDRFGSPHTRPEVGIERDNKIIFSRLLRELDLDTSPPAGPHRPPGLRSNRG